MINPEFQTDKNNTPFSVYPPTTYLTFYYWIYMVPQYKPKNVLMLGYAKGAVAGLIRLIWGEDIPITAVDIDKCENRYNNVEFIQTDAKEFVKSCKEYDCVIVDLFSREDSEPCGFVGSEEFVKDLARISNYLIVNSLHTDMTNYLKRLRKIGINKPSERAESIYYFECKGKIPNLHPHK